jgi:hypothetical protein
MLQRLFVGLHRKLLRTSASNSQARGGRKHTNCHKKLQAVPVPFRSCHLQTLYRHRRRTLLSLQNVPANDIAS